MLKRRVEPGAVSSAFSSETDEEPPSSADYRSAHVMAKGVGVAPGIDGAIGADSGCGLLALCIGCEVALWRAASDLRHAVASRAYRGWIWLGHGCAGADRGECECRQRDC